MLVVDAHQSSPHFRAQQIEGKNARRVFLQNELKPLLQPESLGKIAALPQTLNTAPKFAYNLNWQKELMFGPLDEVYDAGIGPWSLAPFTEDIRINEIHG